MARLAPPDGLAKIYNQSLTYTLGQPCIDTWLTAEFSWVFNMAHLTVARKWKASSFKLPSLR